MGFDKGRQWAKGEKQLPIFLSETQIIPLPLDGHKR